jgi:hypothetical protein
MAIGLAIPLALSAGQALFGGLQSRRARKEFENAEMPDYTQSDAYQTAESTMNLAGRYAQEGLPEQVMRFQEDMIGRSGAAGLATTGSLRAGVGGVASAATSLADQYRQLAAMDANAQLQARGEYMRQRENFQGEQRTAFDNQMGQFINQQASRLGRMSAGNQTMNQGLSNLSGTAAMGIEQGGGKTLMEVLMGPNYGKNGRRGPSMTPMQTIGAPEMEIGTRTSPPSILPPVW